MADIQAILNREIMSGALPHTRDRHRAQFIRIRLFLRLQHKAEWIRIARLKPTLPVQVRRIGLAAGGYASQGIAEVSSDLRSRKFIYANGLSFAERNGTASGVSRRSATAVAFNENSSASAQALMKD